MFYPILPMLSLSKRITLTLLLCLISYSTYAQREQFVLRSEFSPLTDISTGPANNLSNAQVQAFSQYIAYGKRSILNKQGTAILTSTFSYRYTQLSYDFDNSGGPVPAEAVAVNEYLNELKADGLNLHQLQADLLYMKVLNRDWMLYGLARPTLMSDLDGIDLEDFRLELAFFTEYGFSRKFRGGLGLSRSSGFGRVLWIPLARVLYRPARKILIDGVLPSRLDAWYIPSKKWELGIGASLIGGQFSVGENALSGDQFGWANGIAALQVKRLLKGKWYAQVDAGFSLVPRQEITDYDFGIFPTRDILLDLEPDPMPVFRAGVFRVF